MSIITIDDVKYDDFESGESIGEDDDFTSKIGGKIGILLGYLVGLDVLKASDFHSHLKWMLKVIG
jgi:tetrahydromethanopterin S-methyltransferase subunit G